MDNEQGRKFGTAGPLVRVKWNDAAAQIKIHVINGNEPEEHLAKCETVGELIIDDPKVLILCQHWSDTDGIDILAIPRDWCQKVEIIKECTSENLVSQQESQDATTSKSSKNK